MNRTASFTCPNCGGVSPSSANFCEHCAFDLRKRDERSKSRIEQRWKRIAILLLGFVLVLIGGYVGWRKIGHANSELTSKFDLTADEVSTLAHDKMVKEVEANLPKGVTSLGHFGTYKDMMQAKVLDCDISMFKRYLDCKPGANGKLLKLEGRVLALPIGRKIPSVTAISRIDETSAVANVVLEFEPSKGYEIFREWEQAFYKPAIEAEQHKVYLKRYGIGWRIEKVD
ncbi:MAG TPA: zinc ribbon domain-containing protein [Pyrinomonadaceae bacterium]|jgi:hypothetical protein|nr:zinc ribbon domain-containing protein [Pyrinomonadaceae bacterium]